MDTVTMKPPSQPMLRPQSAQIPSGVPEFAAPQDEDDIPAIKIPDTLAAHIAADVKDLLPTSPREDAVLHAFCARLQAWMQEYNARHMRTLDETLIAMKRWIDATTSVDGAGQSHLAETLVSLSKSGIEVLGTPYTAAVYCLTPQGYAVTLTIQKKDMAAFLDELSRMQVWLKEQGYTG